KILGFGFDAERVRVQRPSRKQESVVMVGICLVESLVHFIIPNLFVVTNRVDLASMRRDQSGFGTLLFQEFARLGHFRFFEIVSGDYGHSQSVFVFLRHVFLPYRTKKRRLIRNMTGVLLPPNRLFHVTASRNRLRPVRQRQRRTRKYNLSRMESPVSAGKLFRDNCRWRPRYGKAASPLGLFRFRSVYMQPRAPEGSPCTNYMTNVIPG